MKRISSNKPGKRIIRWLIVGVVVVGSIVGVMYFLKLGPFARDEAPSSTKQTPEQKVQESETDTDAKKTFIETTQAEEIPGTEPPTPTTPETIEITPSKGSGIVTVATKLHGYAAGTCNLTVTNNGKTTSYNANILYQPEFSTCAGFSINISDIGTGQWQINLTVTPEGGAPISKQVMYAV